MSAAIYFLCAATSFACAWLLLYRYRNSGHRLLFWSGLCFVGMTLNNLLLVLDKLVYPEIDLSPYRNASALVAVLLMLFGLIYETD